MSKNEDIVNYNGILNEEKQNFDVLAVPCRGAFIISLDKTEEFLNQKTDPEIEAANEEMAKQFISNNLVDKGPVLRKTR